MCLVCAPGSYFSFNFFVSVCSRTATVSVSVFSGSTPSDVLYICFPFETILLANYTHWITETATDSVESGSRGIIGYDIKEKWYTMIKPPVFWRTGGFVMMLSKTPRPESAPPKAVLAIFASVAGQALPIRPWYSCSHTQRNTTQETSGAP